MKPTPKILSIVSFGILLLVISFVISYTAFKKHSEIVAQMGLIFELYALVLYLINRFKKSKNG